MATIASRIFGALVRARNRGYAAGRLGAARLPRPVASIGNLSTGGSGKTPTAMALGAALLERGVALDVLTRGYGRGRRAGRELAVAQRGDAPAAELGDEPLLIARRLGAPVLIHPDRFRAGLEGERRFGSQLHLLDDGFQHRQLARNFDLVLVSAADLDDRMLPSGRLREPPAALERASAVLWVARWEDEAGAAAELAAARARLRRFSNAPVFLARKRARPLPPPPGRPFAFCGIARPESFFQTLAELGIEPLGRRVFRDHHRYGPGDFRRLRAAAAACSASGWITTAKDWVKIDPRAWAAPAGNDAAKMDAAAFELPRVVEIDMEIQGLAELADLVLRACGR